MNTPDLSCLEVIPDAVAQAALQRRHQAEKDELMRIAAQSALDRSNGGKTLSPEARAWAKRWAAIKPLQGPLGTGEPLSSPQHTAENT